MARRFIDWNGNGSLDTQDLVTSVALEDRDPDDDNQSDEPKNNRQSTIGTSGAGCLLTIVTPIAFAIVLSLPFLL
jgi:hypothetical protein